MRRFFWFIVLLIASVWIGLKVSEDPGYALFMYRHWSVSMPLWFALLSLFALLFVMYLVMGLAGRVDSAFYRWRNWLRSRRKDKSYNKTNRGLLELAEGRWKNAEHCLLEGVNQSSAPVINYLAAAKAAHEQKLFDKRDVYFRKAHDLAPKGDVAVGLMKARMQYQQGQYEQALATLGPLRAVAPRHAGVLKQLEKSYVHLGDWEALLTLLPQLLKENVITQEHYVTFQKMSINNYCWRWIKNTKRVLHYINCGDVSHVNYNRIRLYYRVM